MISGRFSHIRDRGKYKKGILRLFETYVVFQVIHTCFTVLHGGSISLAYIYRPHWTLWYLIVICYWRSIVYVIPLNWLKHRYSVLSISLCISLLAGFIPVGHAFSLQRTLAFLPFFVIGYYSTDINIKELVGKIPLIIAVGTLLVTFGFLFLCSECNLPHVLLCNNDYWTSDFKYAIMNLMKRAIFIPSAIILSIMVMRLVLNHTSFAKWGNITLFIYIYHSFTLRDVLFPLIKRSILPQNELLLFVYSIIIIVVLIKMSKFKFLNILLNPITYWYKK